MKNLSDCRVLIVDDAKANLDILVEGLKSDHKLSLALNGETALQIAARTPPDLVLLDIVMPGLDGCEVCRTLRPGETFASLEQQLGSFACADALATLQPAAIEKGPLPA